MSKRKYTKVEIFKSEIQAMRAEGKTRQEIADSLGLTKEQVKAWINRHNRKESREGLGHEAKPKGRPRKDGEPPRQDVQKELERLRMENKLLRDFLRSTERK